MIIQCLIMSVIEKPLGFSRSIFGIKRNKLPYYSILSYPLLFYFISGINSSITAPRLLHWSTGFIVSENGMISTNVNARCHIREHSHTHTHAFCNAGRYMNLEQLFTFKNKIRH